jgi:hypothetical protein
MLLRLFNFEIVCKVNISIDLASDGEYGFGKTECFSSTNLGG